jgi:hypothetical protein
LAESATCRMPKMKEMSRPANPSSSSRKRRKSRNELISKCQEVWKASAQHGYLLSKQYLKSAKGVSLGSDDRQG